jgi:hypothetical protein
MQGKQLSRVFRALARAIEELDDEQVEIFISSLTQLAPGSLPRKQPTRASHSKVDRFALDEVLRKLSEFSTRQEGLEFIGQMDLRRKELEMLAKLRSIHVTKEDTVERIREKLVEALIGARLNSQAIRGE